MKRGSGLGSAAAVSVAMLLGGTSAEAAPPPLEVQEVARTGAMPKGATLSPDGKRFYVTNFGQANRRNVTVYDAATLELVDTIDLPGIVVESLLSPDGGTLYVSNFSRGTLQAVDVKTHEVTHEIRAGVNPKVLAMSKDGRTLFAANWTANSVTQIDLVGAWALRTLRTGTHPRGMVVTSDGTLYVANFDSASIDVFSGPEYKRAARLPTCEIPRHLALSPDEKTLYVSCYKASQIWALDRESTKVTHKVQVGDNPKSIEVSRDGRYVFSADYGFDTHSVSVVDTTDWSSRVLPVPGMDRGSGIAVARDGAHALVTGWYDSHVYLVGFQGTGGHPKETAKLTLAWLNRPRHQE